MKIRNKWIITSLVVFLVVGLTGSFVIHRIVIERSKPMVHIAFPQKGVLFWQHEIRSTMLSVAYMGGVDGFDWVVDVILHVDVFQDYSGTEELRALEIDLTLDVNGFAKHGWLLEVEPLSDGSARLLIGYIPHRTIVDGDGVLVSFTYRSTEQFDNLVPYIAVHNDPSGLHYIFVVHRQSNFLSRRYIAYRVDVQLQTPAFIGDLVNISPDMHGKPIIIMSEGPLYDGIDVRIFD
jgi:hypothetical protein